MVLPAPIVLERLAVAIGEDEPALAHDRAERGAEAAGERAIVHVRILASKRVVERSCRNGIACTLPPQPETSRAPTI